MTLWGHKFGQETTDMTGGILPGHGLHLGRLAGSASSRGQELGYLEDSFLLFYCFKIVSHSRIPVWLTLDNPLVAASLVLGLQVMAFGVED